MRPQVCYINVQCYIFFCELVGWADCWSLHLAEWIFTCLNLLISRLREVSERLQQLPIQPPASSSTPLPILSSVFSVSAWHLSIRILSLSQSLPHRLQISVRSVKMPLQKIIVPVHGIKSMQHKRAQITRFNAVAFFGAIQIFWD